MSNKRFMLSPVLPGLGVIISLVIWASAGGAQVVKVEDCADKVLVADAQNASSSPVDTRHRKVLFIGIDGCRSDALIAANTPHIDKVIASGAVSYETLIRDGEVTVSGPGWSSMLTGVWSSKHQVINNDFLDPNLDQYPVFFSRLRDMWPDVYVVSVVHWEPINTKIVEGADEELFGSDEEVGQLAVKALSNPMVDVLFVAFDDVDGAGHKFTYDPAVRDYLGVIERTDGYIGQILQALYARPNYNEENWLIILTADHGGINKGHGGNTLEERTIFLAVSGPDSIKGTITPAPALVDAGATALTFLAGTLKCDWDLDGKAVGLDPKVFPAPPVCPRCPRNLTGVVNDEKGEVTLSWIPSQGISASGYEILRDGKVIADATLTENRYVDHPALVPNKVVQQYTYVLHMKGIQPADKCEDLSCQVELLSGEPFFTESFDSLESSLGAAAGETQCASVSGWTHTPPQGWSIESPDMNPDGGVPEWCGWSFATPAFWKCAEDQDRSKFTLGKGVIAIADPDEWADLDPDSPLGLPFNSILISPPVKLPAGESTVIVFDSHFRQEKPQHAEFRISIDGGPDQVLVRYSESNQSDNAGMDVLNSRIRVVVPAMARESTLVMKWALLDAINNWFWAIDNIALYNTAAKVAPSPKVD